MDKRIEDLEVKVAYQEHTIATLSEIIREQAARMDQLERRIGEVQEGLMQALPPIENAKPPHY